MIITIQVEGGVGLEDVETIVVREPHLSQQGLTRVDLQRALRAVNVDLVVLTGRWRDGGLGLWTEGGELPHSHAPPVV